MGMIFTDADEWLSAAAGDGESFARVFDRHHDRVLRHSLRVVADYDDGEDVVAVTFLEAWRKRDDVRFVDGSLLPWLLATATNVGRNLTRSSRRYQQLIRRLPRPSETVETDEIGAALDILSPLSRAQQDVVVLCILEDFSELDAAKALGIAQGTVKSRLSRGKKKMAEHLGSRGVFEMRQAFERIGS